MGVGGWHPHGHECLFLDEAAIGAHHETAVGDYHHRHYGRQQVKGSFLEGSAHPGPYHGSHHHHG